VAPAGEERSAQLSPPSSLANTSTERDWNVNQKVYVGPRLNLLNLGRARRPDGARAGPQLEPARKVFNPILLVRDSDAIILADVAQGVPHVYDSDSSTYSSASLSYGNPVGRKS